MASEEDQVTSAMSPKPSPSPTGGKQVSTPTNTNEESHVNKDPKRSEAAPISKSKDKQVMAPPPKPQARRKRAPGPPPEPKDKRPPLPPGGPRDPYDGSWDREILESYLYLYDIRINYEECAKSLGCSARALEEHLKQVKKRATAKFEGRDKAEAQALRAKAQGLAPPDEETTEEPPTKAPETPSRSRGRPRKTPETPDGHRKRAVSDACEGEGEGEVGPSPSKKAKGDGDGNAPAPSTPSSKAPSTPSSHVKPHRRHRKSRVAVSSPTVAAADDEEGETPMVAEASPTTTKTPSRKRVASSEIEETSPSKRVAVATDIAVTPEPTMVEKFGVAGAQTDGSPAAVAADHYVGRRGKKGVVSLPTLHDIMDGVVKQEGGHAARMRFERSMSGEVAIRKGKNKQSVMGDEDGEKEDEDEDEDEDEELRMQEGMGQVEMTFV